MTVRVPVGNLPTFAMQATIGVAPLWRLLHREAHSTLTTLIDAPS